MSNHYLRAILAPFGSDPLHGRFVTLGQEGQDLRLSTVGDPQEYAGEPELIPRPGLTARDLLKDRLIAGSDLDRTRFSSAHGASSSLKKDTPFTIAGAPNFGHH
jgi:hypothetical protein